MRYSLPPVAPSPGTRITDPLVALFIAGLLAEWAVSKVRRKPLAWP